MDLWLVKIMNELFLADFSEKVESGEVEKVAVNENGAGMETFLYYMLPSCKYCYVNFNILF